MAAAAATPAVVAAMVGRVGATARLRVVDVREYERPKPVQCDPVSEY